MIKSEIIMIGLILILLSAIAVPYFLKIEGGTYTVNYNDLYERNFNQSKRQDQIKILQEAIERALEAHDKKKSQ